MKILIVTGSVVATSGWGRHSSAIAEALRSQGVEVSVCAEEVESETAGGLPCTKIASTNSSFPMWEFLHNVQAVRRAARTADLVHALDGKYGIYGYLATVGTKKDLFLNGIGTYSVAPLYSPWMGWLFRCMYRKAKSIFCISEYTRSQLAQAGVPEEKLVTVHYGAPQLSEPSQEESASYRVRYEITTDAHPIILTVGAIKDRKGQLETLRAVNLLRTTYPNILYLLAGKGNSSSYIAAVRSFIQEHTMEANVRIIEDADDRALAFLYAECTIFALNSNTDRVTHHFEGFGAVIVEAYQFGKPAVGSRDSGIEDAIADGESGLLTEQRSPGDIAEKIGMILKRYDFFSKNASMRYKEFDWQKTAAAYIHAYRND